MEQLETQLQKQKEVSEQSIQSRDYKSQQLDTYYNEMRVVQQQLQDYQLEVSTLKIASTQNNQLNQQYKQKLDTFTNEQVTLIQGHQQEKTQLEDQLHEAQRKLKENTFQMDISSTQLKELKKEHVQAKHSIKQLKGDLAHSQ